MNIHLLRLAPSRSLVITNQPIPDSINNDILYFPRSSRLLPFTYRLITHFFTFPSLSLYHSPSIPLMTSCSVPWAGNSAVHSPGKDRVILISRELKLRIPLVTHRHIVLCDVGRDFELVLGDGRVQVLHAGQRVHLRLDRGRHERCEPPGHHFRPDGRVDDVESL